MNVSRPAKPKKRGSGWTLFCRFVLCGFGAFLLGSVVYHYFDQEQQLSIGLMIGAFLGFVFIGLGLFTSAKTCEKIAESI